MISCRCRDGSTSVNRHYKKTQSAAVNRHLAIQAGMRAPSESAASDPPPIQTRFWTSETAVFHPPSADSGPIQDGMFDDGRDIAMQRFLFDVACLIGTFLFFRKFATKIIRRHVGRGCRLRCRSIKPRRIGCARNHSQPFLNRNGCAQPFPKIHLHSLFGFAMHKRDREHVQFMLLGVTNFTFRCASLKNASELLDVGGSLRRKHIYVDRKGLCECSPM